MIKTSGSKIMDIFKNNNEERKEQSRWEKVIAIITLSVLTVVFSLLLYDKYFPITEGWFHDYARYISQGEFIYRDFYCPVPPGLIWLTTLLCKLTDYSFLALRMYGIIERVFLLIIVFLLLSRVYSNKITFFSLLVGSVIYSSTNTDVFYGYYQTSLLFAMITLYFSVRMYESEEHSRFYAVLYGVFAGITFCMKQNTGAFFAIFIGIGYMLLMREIDFKKSVVNVFCGFLSAMAVLMCLAAFLAVNGALVPFFEQVIGGVSAKGSLINVFTGFVRRMAMSQSRNVLVFSIIIAVFYIANYYVKKREDSTGLFSILKYSIALLFYCFAFYILLQYWLKPIHIAEYLSTRTTRIAIGMVVSTLCLLIVSAFLLNKTVIVRGINLNYVVYLVNFFYFLGFFIYFSLLENWSTDWATCRQLRQYLIYGLFYFNFIIVAFRLVCVKKEIDIKAMLYTASFAFMYIHGMSYIVEDHGTLLLFSLIIGDLLSHETVLNWLKNALVVAFGTFTILTICVQKHNFTYNWWGVNTLAPTYASSFTYSDPLLDGITGDEAQTTVLNSIYELIQNNKKDGDTMYTFPHINYFNVMSGLNSPTFGKVHYFDVCSDDCATSDALILENNLPQFIIWQEFTENEWATHEAIFRGGNLSGQREIRKVVDKYTQNGTYRLLGVFQFNEADPIYIWGLEDGRDWITK